MDVNKSGIIVARCKWHPRLERAKSDAAACHSADGCTDSVHSILIGRLTKQRLAPLSATPLETDRCSVSSTPYNYRLRLNGPGATRTRVRASLSHGQVAQVVGQKRRAPTLFNPRSSESVQRRAETKVKKIQTATMTENHAIIVPFSLPFV